MKKQLAIFVVLLAVFLVVGEAFLWFVFHTDYHATTKDYCKVSVKEASRVYHIPEHTWYTECVNDIRYDSPLLRP